MSHRRTIPSATDGPNLQYQSGYGAGGQAATDFAAGRRFGVPGIPAGMPGWGGQAGVAQSPHPARRMRSPAGPMGGVQTYGSLGYGSMGDGSMDAAVRGSRRFSGAGCNPPCAKGEYCSSGHCTTEPDLMPFPERSAGKRAATGLRSLKKKRSPKRSRGLR